MPPTAISVNRSSCVGRSRRPDLPSWAASHFELALPALLETSSPRTWVFGLLGIREYRRRLGGDRLVGQVHDTLTARLSLDDVRVCYHTDRDGCDCRKPAPGLLLREPRYDLSRSIMVGDRWRDIEAGRRARVRTTILIGTGYGETFPVSPDVRVGSLAEAADWILAMDAEGGR